MEMELQRLMFSLELDWEQFLNTRIGGTRSKKCTADGTPFRVVVCYNIGGVGDFKINLHKRIRGEKDFARPLACLLKSSQETLLRALGNLNPSEPKEVICAAQIASDLIDISQPTGSNEESETNESYEGSLESPISPAQEHYPTTSLPKTSRIIKSAFLHRGKWYLNTRMQITPGLSHKVIVGV